MIHDEAKLEIIESLEASPWRGAVYRHMFADYPPDLENTQGARWNPPEVPAIYLSLQPETALAEAEYSIAVQPVPPRIKRTLYRIAVDLQSVIRLDLGTLAALGVTESELRSSNMATCQAVGDAAAWLRLDGIIVPSVRAEGENLVVYPNNRAPDGEFTVLDMEIIADPTPI